MEAQPVKRVSSNINRRLAIFKIESLQKRFLKKIKGFKKSFLL
jgi:hypothetical protein